MKKIFLILAILFAVNIKATDEAVTQLSNLIDNLKVDELLSNLDTTNPKSIIYQQSLSQENINQLKEIAQQKLDKALKGDFSLKDAYSNLFSGTIFSINGICSFLGSDTLLYLAISYGFFNKKPDSESFSGKILKDLQQPGRTPSQKPTKLESLALGSLMASIMCFAGYIFSKEGLKRLKESFFAKENDIKKAKQICWTLSKI